MQWPIYEAKMKITSTKTDSLNHSSVKALSPPQGPDLLSKPPSYSRKYTRRKTKNSGAGTSGVRQAGRRSRPETPLLRWKFDEGRRGNDGEEKSSSEVGRRTGRKVMVGTSGRKLGAALWRMQLPEAPAGGGDRIGFQVGHSLQISSSAMEGATKWDPIGQKASDDVKHAHPKFVDQQSRVASVISSLEAELEKAQVRVNELETERRSSKKKVQQFLRKLSEERAVWRSREHGKIRVIIDDMKLDLNRERKNRQRLEIVNSKLVNELANAKLTAKRYMQDYEKEWKARELIEEVCDELAKEIGEDKDEIEELKRESMGLREEVDEERKMLQIAEVWREERVQMKLVDAKLILEDKYTQINRLIADIESFLNSRGPTPGTEEIRTELLRQAAASLNIQDIREFTYEPPNPDEIFSVFEDVNHCEPNERQIERCDAATPASQTSKVHIFGPEANGFNKDNIQRNPNPYVDQSGDLEEEEGSEWETMSHLEDQGSSYSPGASDPSVNRSHRDSNASRSGSEWDENRGEGTLVTEITKICSLQNRQLKKVSSMSRLWRSCPGNGENYKIISLEGVNTKLSNGRLSNGAIHSPDYHSGKGGLSPPDLAGQWSSPDSGSPHINRGMKGCIEWPRSAQKSSLKAKLLEARMENQKIQLRQVLKQKI